MEFTPFPSSSFYLADRAVRVWFAEFDSLMPLADVCTAVLSAEEKERAARFINAELSLRFILAHGLLRHILGRALSLPPDNLVFVTEKNGKPCLASGFGDLQFNLSHSAHAVLIATSSGIRLGVDMEEMKELDNMSGMADVVFPAESNARLMSLPPPERLVRFYQLWTRLEAVAKATGQGIGSLIPYGPEGSSPLDISADQRRWQILDLTIPDHGEIQTAAALCLETGSSSVTTFTAGKDVFILPNDPI